MTYQATWHNREQTASGVSATLRLVDDAVTNPYPTIRKRLDFDGKQLSDLTAGFLASIAAVESARAIQQDIISRANKRLDNIVGNRWDVDVVAALATMETNVRNRLAAQSLDNASLQTLILSEWTTYGVSGLVGNPVVQTVIQKPNVGSVIDEIVVGN